MKAENLQRLSLHGIRRSKVYGDLRLRLQSGIRRSKVYGDLLSLHGIRRSKIASSYYDLQTVKAESFQRLSLHGIRRSKVYSDLRFESSNWYTAI